MNPTSIDYNLALAIIGFVVSVLAQRLPGLSTFWGQLSGNRKRAYVALAAVLFGIGATLVQGGDLVLNDALADVVRYAVIAFGAAQAGYVYSEGGK